MRKNLIEKRKSKGYTQKEIARELGISERQYCRMEAGTSEGSIGVWKRIRDKLGVKSIDDLLE